MSYYAIPLPLKWYQYLGSDAQVAEMISMLTEGGNIPTPPYTVADDRTLSIDGGPGISVGDMYEIHSNSITTYTREYWDRNFIVVGSPRG